jgi:drug/metabolite transporter (DMT)-like permease
MLTRSLSLYGAETRSQSAIRSWSAALATVIIWAFWMIGTRHAVTHSLTPAAIGLLRFATPALVLAPVWWRIGLFPRGLRPITALGLLGSGVPFFFIVATAMQFAPAADIGPLLPGTMPLFVALIGWIGCGERFSRWRIGGFALILIGIAVIGGRGLLTLETGVWRGHALLLAGAFMWGLYTHAYRRSGLTPIQGAALVALWSTLILLPFGAPPLMNAFMTASSGVLLVQAVLQGLVSGVVNMVLYSVAINGLGASRAAAISPLGPVFASLIAIPVLGEIPDLAAILGLLAATCGVVLASGVWQSRHGT